jgi:cytochrome b involved in lipid metabolism
MKTKFGLLIIFNVCLYCLSYSQNSGGIENPDSLNVTFSDTTQNLQVNGSMVVDSSLTVKDSVIMEDNLHIYERLQLEKDAHLKKDVYVGNEIKVEKDAYLEKDTYIGNTLKVDGESYFIGDAYFNQKVILNNLNSIDSTAFDPSNDPTTVNNQLKVVFINEEGVLEKGNSDDLIDMVYFGKACNEIIGEDGLPYMVETPPNPTWQNGPNKLFLAECPNLAKVGIGTSNPTHKLHTVGNVLFTKTLQVDGNVAIGAQPSNFSTLKIKNPDKSAGLEIDQTGNNQSFAKLLFLEYSNPATEIIKVTNTVTNEVPFLLQANGSMTIHNGTQKTLQLNADGTLQARVIILDAYNWPDYVFKKNYDLMPLSKIKKYIEVNGHLPEVPSARETAENGIDIAEMNKILLQKIEELTLHLIEQDERIKELEIRKSKD